MRKLLMHLSAALAILIVLLAATDSNAQRRYAPFAVGDFMLTIQNVTQVDSKNFTFDIYLQDTDAAQQFEMASVQAGILINSGIYNSGTVTCTIVAGTSTLSNTTQVPNTVTFTQTQNCIKLAGRVPPGAGNGSIISTTAPGTRIITLKVTNTADFTAGSNPNLTYTPNSGTGIPYLTRVAAYISGSNTQLTVTPGVNAIGAGIILNPPPPAAYNVGGSGSYCQGGSGLTVTLSGSETGVSYQLYKDGSASGATVPGTGAGLSWTNQLAGTYTITGTNGAGTTTMTGSAIITETPLPGAAGTITGTANVVQGTSGVAYSVPPIANATGYVWNYTGTGATINGAGPAITIDFSPTATSGQLSVYGTNPCGSGTISSFFDIFLSPAMNVWTGAVSTDWFTPGNWSNNVVPTAADDVDIPAVANLPLVAGGVTAVCADAEVHLGAAITISGTMTLSGTLTLDGGVNIVVSNTGSLIDNGIAGAGTASVEKLFTSPKWHYISSPVSNGTSNIVLGDWLAPWDCAAQAWGPYIMATTYPLNVAEGYATYTRVSTPPLKSFSGLLNTGSVSHLCATGAPNFYCLVGNPYASALDLASPAVVWPSASHTAYFWNPDMQTYRIYTTVAPSHSQYAPVAQGFFIEVPTPGLFGAANAARVHNAESFLKDNGNYPNVLKINATNLTNQFIDQAVVGFVDGTTTGYDYNFDAAKLANGNEAPSVFSMINDQKVAHNILPSLTQNTVVPMGFTSGINGNVTFNAENLESFDASVSIYLEDLKEGTIQNLNSNPVYTFAYTTGDNANRFVLHFSAPTAIGENASGVQVYSFESSVYIKNLNNLKLQNVTVYDLLGKEVFRSALNQNPLQKFTLSVNGGYYLVKVVSENGVTTQKVYIN